MIDVGSSTIETFSEHLNSKFQTHYGDSHKMELELLSVNDVGSTPRQIQFSLVFLAPENAPLSQGIYRLAHEKLGTFNLFLVPIAKDKRGVQYIANITAEVRILDITLLPQHRNTGIGTAILRGLMTEAASIGKPLRIYVESYNPSQRLFERLGFVKSSESGYSYLLEWSAGDPEITG